MKEGSFEGLMSGLEFVTPELSQNESEVSAIRTPNQIPDRLDFTGVSENIMKSHVVESLISQNDDLMARLTVSLRRIAHLEEKWSDSQTETARFKSKYDNLKDQVLVLKEQARLLAERSRQSNERQQREDQSIAELKDQIRIFEIRYAELYNTSQKRQSELESEMASMQAQVHQADRIVARQKKYRDRLKPAIRNLKQKLRLLSEKKAQQELSMQDLRNNVSELSAYVSEQNKSHQQQIADLTSAYEAEARGLHARIDDLDQHNQSLRARTAQMDSLQKDKIRLENDLIIAARREEDLILKSSTEITELQKSVAQYRQESKELAVNLESAQRDLFSTKEENELNLSEKKALAEQVETLQLLWREQQNQFEKLNEQKNSLQKLNQDLSITINEYRREVRDLKEKLEDEVLRSSTAEKILSATQDMKEKTSASSSPAEKTSSHKKSEATPELLSKIDKALSHLHTGH